MAPLNSAGPPSHVTRQLRVTPTLPNFITPTLPNSVSRLSSQLCVTQVLPLAVASMRIGRLARRAGGCNYWAVEGGDPEMYLPHGRLAQSGSVAVAIPVHVGLVLPSSGQIGVGVPVAMPVRAATPGLAATQMH